MSVLNINICLIATVTFKDYQGQPGRRETSKS